MKKFRNLCNDSNTNSLELWDLSLLGILKLIVPNEKLMNHFLLIASDIDQNYFKNFEFANA